MVIDVSPIEAIWVIVNTATLVLTVIALIDANQDAAAVRALNGHAVRIASRGNVRREILRLSVQVLLLVIAVPGIFVARPIPLSLPIICLVAIPVVLLVQTVLDARERHRLTGVLEDHLAKEERDVQRRVQDELDRLDTPPS